MSKTSTAEKITPMPTKKEFHFDVPERFTLVGLLPQQENYTTMRLVGDLRSALLFSEEEVKEIEFTTTKGDDGSVRTEWKKNVEKTIPLGPIAEQLFRDALKKLDSEKKLEARHLSLFEKFQAGAKE